MCATLSTLRADGGPAWFWVVAAVPEPEPEVSFSKFYQNEAAPSEKVTLSPEGDIG